MWDFVVALLVDHEMSEAQSQLRSVDICPLVTQSDIAIKRQPSLLQLYPVCHQIEKGVFQKAGSSKISACMPNLAF
jgi:hypothetical protein